jgi:anti-sigma-K factor RskA
MSAHEQFAEDLALYALGTLQGDECLGLQKHLENCADCRRELELLRGDMSLVALTVSGPKPPARARQRLLKAVANEPRRSPAPARRAWWMLVPSFAAVALAIVAVIVASRNVSLQQRIAGLENQLTRQQAELQQAREVVSTLTASDAMTVTLVAAKTPPQPQGRVMYLRDRGSLIFLASNLPALPTHRAYELWLIPTTGAPLPAGVFKPNAHGSASVTNPPLPKNVEAKAFAITVEPEAGSTTPTMPIFMMGAGE